ncbi:MAG TPA: hypothetical protein VK086_03965 [Ruania sp.]|nr:hypothetical protein [Ruania sp.]
MASRFVRKVRTASGAVAVQVVTRQGRQVVDVAHVGSAQTDADLELLLQAAEEQLRPGQEALDLGPLERTGRYMGDVADWTGTEPEQPEVHVPTGRPRVVAGGGQVLRTSALVLWEAPAVAYRDPGFGAVEDAAFRALVLARIIEPTSKADTVRVLNEVGVSPPALNTIYRSLQRCQTQDYRGTLAKACLAHSARTSGRAVFIMYDVTTLLCRPRHKHCILRTRPRTSYARSR